MKRIAIIILAAVSCFLGENKVSAQGKYGADSAECIKYLSYYKEYYKQKNYDAALPNWRKAYAKCPVTASQNLLIDGSTLLRKEIAKNAANKQYREALIDSLLNLHEQRATAYPSKAITALNNKGTDMINYLKGQDKRLYDELNGVIARNQLEVSSSILFMDLQSAINLYQNGQVDPEEVINVYQRNMEMVEKITPENNLEKEKNEKVKTDMESIFITSKVASCDNLIALFTPRYEANSSDLDLVKNIVTMMSSTDDCTDNDLYLKAATSMYKLEPSAQAAYFLYRLNAARGNEDEAISYMEQAIASPDIDAATSANYNYQLSQFALKNGKNAKALAAAKKALELDSTLEGKCYQIMANVWATTNCSGDEIQRRAKYWVATDYMQKAKNADASLTDDCNRAIGQYSAYYPKAEDAFMYDITNGQAYTISCGGMTATTTVRTNK